MGREPVCRHRAWSERKAAPRPCPKSQRSTISSPCVRPANTSSQAPPGDEKRHVRGDHPRLPAARYRQALLKADRLLGRPVNEPYVPEKTAFAIKYHQALRFFADPAYGYEYPDLYRRLFGEDYVPLPHIRADYEMLKKHPWYEAPRLVTVNDFYSFDPKAKISIDPFREIIGRHFKQPKEGLGNDNSPVAHMWRTIAHPDMAL